MLQRHRLCVDVTCTEEQARRLRATILLRLISSACIKEVPMPFASGFRHIVSTCLAYMRRIAQPKCRSAKITRTRV